jgi:transcriptional regulator with XRE-family HTH domain
MTAGLTQARLAALTGVAQQEVSLVELGAQSASLAVRCRLAAACGHELGWRLFPVAAVRLRDSGQLGLAQAIAAQAHPSWQIHLEAPVAPGDPRAADLLLVGPAQIIHLEIERALVDLQAQLRAAQLKREALSALHRRPVRLVIAVPDSRTTRARLAPHSELLARTMRQPSRTVWQAIRSGQPLEADGILFVRPARD